MNDLRRLRLSRTRATLAAFALGLTLGLVLAPTAPLPASPTYEPGSGCGHYPAVALRRDCYLARNRGLARSWAASSAAACIRAGERSGRRSVNPAGPYYGEYQLGLSAWRSVGPDRFDSVHPFRSHRLYVLKARRLFVLRGFAPWPPARGCR